MVLPHCRRSYGPAVLATEFLARDPLSFGSRQAEVPRIYCENDSQYDRVGDVAHRVDLFSNNLNERPWRTSGFADERLNTGHPQQKRPRLLSDERLV